MKDRLQPVQRMCKIDTSIVGNEVTTQSWHNSLLFLESRVICVTDFSITSTTTNGLKSSKM